jgi:hypothetical protein
VRVQNAEYERARWSAGGSSSGAQIIRLPGAPAGRMTASNLGMLRAYSGQLEDLVGSAYKLLGCLYVRVERTGQGSVIRWNREGNLRRAVFIGICLADQSSVQVELH